MPYSITFLRWRKIQIARIGDSRMYACTCKCRIAEAAGASLSLTISKGLGRAAIGAASGAFSKQPPSSASIAKRARPSACDSNSCWESNRCMRETRSVQSSCNSHLQNISTKGRSCMQVLRMACREGGGRRQVNMMLPHKPSCATARVQRVTGSDLNKAAPHHIMDRRKTSQQQSYSKFAAPSLERQNSDSCSTEWE